MFLIASMSRRTRHEQTLAQHLRFLDAVPAAQTGASRGHVIGVYSLPRSRWSMSSGREIPPALRVWWKSVHRLGLRATLFYDDLTAEEVAAIRTERIVCRPMASRGWGQPFDRHFQLRDYVASLAAEFVFVTDAAEVSFCRDPFELIAGDRLGHRLYAGRESPRISLNGRVRREMKRQFGRVLFPHRPLLTPGLLGGRREDVLRVYDQLTALMECLSGRLTASDLVVFNRAVHECFPEGEILCGPSLHSRFSGWESQSPAAITYR